MGWHYACKKIDDGLGNDVYILVEVFPDLQNGHTDGNGIGESVCGESPADLAKWLRLAADDVEKYGVIEENPL